MQTVIIYHLSDDLPKSSHLWRIWVVGVQADGPFQMTIKNIKCDFYGKRDKVFMNSISISFNIRSDE